VTWQRVIMKPFGQESGRARLCNSAGCSAQRDSEQAPKGEDARADPSFRRGRPLRSGDEPDGALSVSPG